MLQSTRDADLELTARAVCEPHDTLLIAAEDGVGLLARVRPAGRSDTDIVCGTEVDLSRRGAFAVFGGVALVLLDLRFCCGVLGSLGKGGGGEEVGAAVCMSDGVLDWDRE